MSEGLQPKRIYSSYEIRIFKHWKYNTQANVRYSVVVLL